MFILYSSLYLPFITFYLEDIFLFNFFSFTEPALLAHGYLVMLVCSTENLQENVNKT